MPRQPKMVAKKVGRPALPKGEAKAVMLCVRITAEESKAIEAAAKANNLKPSEWIRSTINANL